MFNIFLINTYDFDSLRDKKFLTIDSLTGKPIEIESDRFIINQFNYLFSETYDTDSYIMIKEKFENTFFPEILSFISYELEVINHNTFEIPETLLYYLLKKHISNNKNNVVNKLYKKLEAEEFNSLLDDYEFNDIKSTSFFLFLCKDIYKTISEDTDLIDSFLDELDQHSFNNQIIFNLLIIKILFLDLLRIHIEAEEYRKKILGLRNKKNNLIKNYMIEEIRELRKTFKDTEFYNLEFFWNNII